MFKKAQPIWLKGFENEMITQAQFVAVFEGKKDITIKMTGATYYRVYVNDVLVHYGPARCAGGYARIDIVPVDEKILCDKNTIKIDATCYLCNSFASVKQKGFICAEVLSGDECIAATGFDFKGYNVTARDSRVMRYSYQRQFSEVWDTNAEAVLCDITNPMPEVTYLERHAPLPDLTQLDFDITSVGEFAYCSPARNHNKIRFIDVLGPGETLGIPKSQIKEKPFYIYDQIDYNVDDAKKPDGNVIPKGKYAFFDCGRNHTGMIRVKYNAKPGTKAFIVFDEKMIDGKMDYNQWSMINIIQLTSEGETDFTSFEVYGFKFAAVFVIEGEIALDQFSVINYKNPIKNPPVLKCDDEVIQGIYTAAIETLRQNAVDIYTDCPTRERAGWLCDSFYSALAEYAFTGDTAVEDDFVENYLLQSCPDIPEGMLPMCYPGDHISKTFIPQWSMWFVREIEGYVERNPAFDVEKFRKIADGLLGFFAKYENELGLLEDLPSWNFVEWSKANSWTAGVNFPTNMLYSEMLCIISKLFGDKALFEKAEKIRKTAAELSYNGTFFCDQAERDENGKLVTHPDRITEVCQYYAFRFGGYKPEDYPELYKILTTDFYPDTDKYPEIPKVNAFIGMYVRLELLRMWGLRDKLVDEIKAFFGGMAQYTGTLWENKTMTGSLNHGFASYVGALLLEIYNG